MKKFVLLLTVLRIFAGPLLFLSIIILDANFLALCIFVVASISDFLDGFLARSFNVESSLGAILDPIADKILVLFALFTITVITKDPFIGGIAALILSREFWVSALREFAASNSLSDLTKVTFLAKIKTSVQFISITMFFLGFWSGNALVIFLASFMLFLAALISIKTAIDYSNKIFNL